MRLTIESLIEQVLLEKQLYPFNLEFDESLFYKTIKKYKHTDKKAADLIKFILTSHKIYVSLVEDIRSTFEKIGIDADQIRFLLFKTLNEETFNSTNSIQDILHKNDIFPDLESLHFVSVENPSGDQMQVSATNQIPVDITSELLLQLANWHPEDSKIHVHSKSANLASFHRLWAAANIICNIRDTIFGQIFFDKCWIEWIDSLSIKLVRPSSILEYVRSANEIRSSSIGMHIILTLRATFDKGKINQLRLKTCLIKEGQLIIQTSESDDVNNYISTLSFIIKFHPQLAKIPLIHFGGLSIEKLLEVLSVLIGLFDFSNSDYSKNDNNEIPVWISYQSIIKNLSTCLKLEESVIIKIIDSLCTAEKAPYFWRTPFQKIGDKLFFAVYPFMAPNIHLFIDKWLQLENLPELLRITLYKNLVIHESDKKECSYEFDLLNPEVEIEGENIFQTNLCYIIRDSVLLLECCIHPYPVESSEHDDVLKHLSSASMIIKEKVPLLQKHYSQIIQNRKILTAILTEYPTYSGISMNGVPVLDHSLLNNYFFTGWFMKKTESLIPGTTLKGNIAHLEYYNNEDSFNKNLLYFLSHPYPVTQLIENMKLVPMSLLPPFSKLQVLMERVDHIGEKALIEGKIDDLEKLMLYEYHVEPDISETYIIDNNIQYQLAIVLHRLACAKYMSHSERWRITNSFINARRIGQSHLIYFLLQGSSELATYKSNNPTNYFNSDIEVKDVVPLYERLREHTQQNIIFSEFRMPSIFNDQEEKLLISTTINVINSKAYQELADDDIEFLAFNLMILAELSKKYSCRTTYYNASINFIDLLNFSHHYQKARDFSEELLMMAIKNDEHSFGWHILFTCYTTQNNLIEATLYGCLFFSAMKSNNSTDYYFISNGTFTLLKFFRNFGYIEMSHEVYKTINSLQLKEEDEQKILNVYFQTLLKYIDKNPDSLDPLFSYLMNKENEIIRNKTHSCIPWLSILYNIKRRENMGHYNPKERLDDYISRLETYCDPAIITQIRNKILGHSENSKNDFIGALIKIFDTRYSKDIVHELSNLSFNAENLIQDSILSKDMEGLLLAALAMSDISLIYENKEPIEGLSPLIKGQDPNMVDRLKNYKSTFLKELKLEKGQLLAWLFQFDKKYGVLLIFDNKEICVELLPEWDEKKLTNWIDRIQKFYFNSSNIKLSDYDLTAQENDYNYLQNFFSFSKLPALPAVSELLISSSIEMATIPHNLMTIDLDFAAAKIPISNVLSPAYFLNNSTTVELGTNCKMAAWIPKDEGNIQIVWGYSLLEPLLIQYNVHVETSHYPNLPLEADINIFLAHGVREISGFKAVRTSGDPRSSILQPSRVFGQGNVAIMFICNAGSLTEDLYSKQVVSLSTYLLKSGYKAVIASFWPYDVTMSYRWLKMFLESFHNFNSIANAVFEANNKLAEYDQETSTIFYAPAGRFAMHLFGNPNIYIRKK